MPIETESQFDALAASPPAVGEPPRIEDLFDLFGAEPGIVIDASPGWRTAPLLLDAVRRGHAAVLANDQPLVEDVASFRTLLADRRGRCEAAVAGGLSVVSTLESAIDGGDRILAIDADLGALGPWDPRDPPLAPSNLVARQALILARILGADLRPDAVRVRPADGAWVASAGPVSVRAAPAGGMAATGAGPARVALTTVLHRDPPLVMSGSAVPSPERLAGAVLRDLLVLAREEDKPWRADRRSRLAGSTSR
jgi:hypothetical protein